MFHVDLFKHSLKDLSFISISLLNALIHIKLPCKLHCVNIIPLSLLHPFKRRHFSNIQFHSSNMTHKPNHSWVNHRYLHLVFPLFILSLGLHVLQPNFPNSQRAIAHMPKTAKLQCRRVGLLQPNPEPAHRHTCMPLCSASCQPIVPG